MGYKGPDPLTGYYATERRVAGVVRWERAKWVRVTRAKDQDTPSTEAASKQASE